MRAAGTCFATWLAERGGAGPAEEAAALTQIRHFLETHGESRFTLLDGAGDSASAPAEARTINRAGWRRRMPSPSSETWEYLILP